VLSAAYQQAQFAQGKFSVETVSVGELFAGSMIPGLLLVVLYIVYQAVFAALLPHRAPPIPLAERGARPVSFGEVGRVLVPPIVLIVAVLGSIIGGVATPTEAASVGAVGATLLASLRLPGLPRWPAYVSAVAIVGLVTLASQFDMRLGRANPPAGDRVAMILAAPLALALVAGVLTAFFLIWRRGVLQGVMRATTSITAMIFATLIGATLFALVFRGLGGDDMVHEFLKMLPGGMYGALFAIMGVIFLMGFFLDFVEITIIVIPIVGPIILAMGVDPVWFGVMIAVNLQTSFLTPPFGFSLFYLRGVAPASVGTMDIYRGIVPFVALQLAGLAAVMAFPALATWLPGLLFK
jgi:TRAP-type mannitol/chloroaromatic compound transport system permease large subunit